ncbi:MAG: secondary thiamine-phosphate synthase enzyme YjbQ [Fidelibacterota bacterium]
MNISTTEIKVSTKGNSEIIDITDKIQKLISEKGYNEGNVTIFIPGSTAGVTTIEYEPGLKEDLPEAFERFAPSGINYHHHMTWHDGNGHSHVRAAVLGPSLTVPFSKGNLQVGTWQQVVLMDFDIHPRDRRIIFQFIYK